MFSLIITIISIALVAALALATIYYGGSAFSKGGDAAKAVQLINEGQQLQGAYTLALVDVKAHTAVADLVAGGYLAQAPAGWSQDNTRQGFVSPAVTTAVCEAVNAKSGQTNGSTTLDADKAFGCLELGAAKAVVYRF